jgi:hypothetical protein
MKTLLRCTILVILFATTVAIGGNSHIGRKVQKDLSVTGGEEIQTMNPSGYPYNQVYAIGPGDSIGFTTYDYGTNGSANHNLINYGDGGVSLGRMAATEPGNGDRGTWYSYSTNRGSTWRPLTKVETARYGWSNIDQFRSTAGSGIELTVAHTGLQVNLDNERGAGSWISFTTNSTASATWPRLAIGGDLNVHIIAGAGNPPTGYIYSRSTDAGASFSPVDLPVLTAFPPSADGWDIAARGDKVVMVGTSQTEGRDIIIQVSTNNGNTWTTQTIYDVAGAGELPTGQQQPQPDGSCAVIMDNAGTIHVTWGNFMAIGDASNNPVNNYSFHAGIMHWSSATGVRTLISEAPVQDSSIANLSGAIGHDGNFATQPDIGVDANNNLYVVFSSLTAGLDAAGNAYEHAYASRSTNGGLAWSRAVDITPGTGFDAAFPSLADLVDTHLYIVYNSDRLAGNSIQGNHPENQTAIMFLKVPISALLSGVGEEGRLPETYTLAQNYPNPFNPGTKIEYGLPERAHVTLKVYDVLGREVATLVDDEVNAGYHQVTFDGSKLSSGLYFYRLASGHYSATKRLMLLK